MHRGLGSKLGPSAPDFQRSCRHCYRQRRRGRRGHRIHLSGHDVHRKTAEVGYWLGEPFWGQGIATTTLGALTEYAFANFDLARLEAAVYEWNPASARVLEKCGCVLEGRLRKSVT